MDAAIMALGEDRQSPSPAHLGGRPQHLYQVFERQVCARPEARAIEALESGEGLSYRELDRRAGLVASRLFIAGIRPGDIVGLYLPRCVEHFVGMLGILKAGAAYLPIDVEFPGDRIQHMLSDAGAKLIVGYPGAGISGELPLLDLGVFDWAEVPAVEFFPSPSQRDLSYVIYTSGTTGTPKGVAISHLNALSYVDAVEQVYGVEPSDRIFQGFSTAFDASLEEIWMAFSAGATLVVGATETVRAADELPRWFERGGITVFSTVPTLLGLMEPGELKRLRMVVFGGEAARADIIEKWAAPGRLLMNTYGPTEATVVATYAWCRPDEPITIGVPLPGYETCVVDSRLAPLPDGREGELCIGGPAVSLLGYLNRPELNAQKFFEREGVRYYRSGDLVFRDAKGLLHFRGRIDSQVKIRGYRVELEEIETQIARFEGCKGAVVSVHEDTQRGPQLVAYILQDDRAPVALPALVAQLRAALPPYMVPAHFAKLVPEAISRLTSGKVDRRSLPALADCELLGAARASAQPNDLGCSRLERRLLAIFRTVLGEPIGVDESFFDYGGNSVSAAEAISCCRDDARLSMLGIRDLYQNTSARALAQQAERRAQQQMASGAVAVEAVARVSRAQYAACVSAQTIVLLLVTALAAYASYGVYLATQGAWSRLDKDPAALWSVGAALVVFGVPAALFTLPLLWALLWKWLVIGRFREGDYPLWSWAYFRWWLSNLALAPTRALSKAWQGTPMMNFSLRLMGAKIGRGVFVGSPIDEADLVTIEPGASIADNVVLRTHSLQGGVLRLRAIHIGKEAFVGSQSVIGGGVRVGGGSRIHHLSSVAEGSRVPAGSEWSGSPARQLDNAEASELSALLNHHEASAGEPLWARPRAAFKVAAMQAGMRLSYRLLGLVPWAACLGILYLVDRATGAVSALTLSVVLPLAFVLAAVRFYLRLAVIVAAKWIFTGRAREGTIRLDSFEYVKRWFVRRLMDELVTPGGTRGVTETLLMPHVCRWLGMKVGQNAEISDAGGFQPDLVRLGEGSMLADRCIVGQPVVHRGLMSLGAVELGARSFLANAAHLPITAPRVPDDSLIGVLSLVPERQANSGDWLGSPPMRLPRRSRSEAPAELTFNPPRHLRWGRAVANVFKMVLPGALVEVVLWTTLKAVLAAYAAGVATFALALPLIVVASHLSLLLLPVAAKWLLIGRYRAGQHPLWSGWMWRMEIVYEIELMVTSLFGPLLGGTPWLNSWYRLMGATIGSRVCIHHGALMEADLIRIGDNATIEGFLQTHLFEDRVMKLGPVEIEAGCSVGREACVLYHSRMGSESQLLDLSLIMKRETFLPHRQYSGLPAENAGLSSVTTLEPSEASCPATALEAA